MLNKQQQQVIDSDFPILNIAGPGSGKTKTMLSKISLKLVKSKEDLKDILILTFTNKAADSVFTKIEKQLNEKIDKKEFYTGTFHSIFFKLIKENSSLLNKEFGFKNTIKIIEPDEDYKLFYRFTKLEFDQTDSLKKKDFEKMFLELHDFTVKDFYNFKKNKINKIASFKEIIEYIKTKTITPLEEEKLKLEIILKKYFLLKIKDGKMSFEDILLYFYLLLFKNEEFKLKINKQFKYVLVDEFQDTNPIQNEIINLITNNNDYVVGDPYQSIYRFLGAEISNIIDRAKRDGMNVIQLNENYRSSENIVQFTNDITQLFNNKIPNFIPCISSNKEVKNLKIKIRENVNQEQEVLNSIKKRISENNIPLDEIAVLTRTNFETYSLEKWLYFANIPFKKIGGQGFYKKKEIIAVLNIVQLLSNNYNILTLENVLNLVKGIGPKVINTIINNYINDKQINLNNIYEYMIKLFPKNKKIKDLDEILFNIKELNIQTIKNIINHEHFDLINKFQNTKDTKEKKDEVLKNIDYILDEIHSILKKDSISELEEYLSAILLDNKKEEDKEKPKITLSTIHAAKGLEWNSCYILNAQDSIFPSQKSLSYEKDIEEEKRLLYVAVSRAKEYLMITSGGKINYFIEPFIENNYIDNNRTYNNYDIFS